MQYTHVYICMPTNTGHNTLICYTYIPHTVTFTLTISSVMISNSFVITDIIITAIIVADSFLDMQFCDIIFVQECHCKEHDP